MPARTGTPYPNNRVGMAHGADVSHTGRGGLSQPPLPKSLLLGLLHQSFFEISFVLSCMHGIL